MKIPRYIKAAKRSLKTLARSSYQQRTPTTTVRSLDQLEGERSTRRLARHVETKKRNAEGQALPRGKRYKKTSPTTSESENLQCDKLEFFDRIDEPLLRVCGSCGELANSVNAVLKVYNSNDKYFDPLKNEEGEIEIIPEGLVSSDSSDNSMSIWLCDRCNRSIRARKVPKFCRASGFKIGDVPTELAVLNRIEARLIGLGISFTTCVNLYCDGQEFTRGNAINYWNEPGKTVRELPRPLQACGVVFLKKMYDSRLSYFRVRPSLVRKALMWLILNNPLYCDVTISEENLQALESVDVEHDVPIVTITDEEVNQLGGAQKNVNETQNHTDKATSQLSHSHLCTQDTSFSDAETEYVQMPSLEDKSKTTCTCPGHPCILCNSRTMYREITDTATDMQPLQCRSEDVMDNLTESFELEGNQNSQKSELEHIINAVGVQTSQAKIPVGELRCREDPIDEYQTKHIMQMCFPTLFPNGYGGYNPLSKGESRMHDYSLSDYCAHLMKWHDRRFIIHGNVKFFCLNLIQRRQIDGLVKRVAVTDRCTEAIQTASGGHEHSPVNRKDRKEELTAAVQVLDSLKPYFRVVRGSGLYWSNVRDDLMAMIGNRVMPTRWPTFFLTLCAADTIWPDFARACNPALTLDQCKNLSFSERRRYLNENPDISARHFSRRFQAFFDKILMGKAKPLGEIVDFFWRVEFQQRGSPHIHCLLWIKDAPDVLKLSETEDGRLELAQFIDKHISVLTKTLKELDSCQCYTCTTHRKGEFDILAMRPPDVGSSEWNCDLSRLVQRVQQHVCNGNSACRKKTSECRFGFPKQLQENTVIETSTSTDGTTSLKVKLKREVSTINNYSPNLLSCWRANMDLQLIGNSYGAAEYAGAYISKAEPDTLRFRRVITKAIQRSDPNLSFHSTLKRVANSTLSVREVGAPEAIYILLRNLSMYSKSRTIKKVKVLRHNQRFYRVAPQGIHDLIALAETPDSGPLRIEHIERAYMNRPSNKLFNNMSYATFIEEYEAIDFNNTSVHNANVWTRTDNEGCIKRRDKPVVLQKSPWMRPNSSNPNFCFSEVFLYVPWRTITDLPDTDEECFARFFNVQSITLQGELQQESNAKLARQHQLDLLKNARDSCNLASFTPSEYVFVSQPSVPETNNENERSDSNHDVKNWKSRHNYSSETVVKARDFVNACLKPWMKEKKDTRTLGAVFSKDRIKSSKYQYPIEKDDENGLGIKDVMSDSQWIPFALSMDQTRKRFISSLGTDQCKPLHMIINGEGGSGKSWLIRHIVKDVHNVFEEHSSTRRTSRRVLLLAHQGTAACNIKGVTLCSALGFSSFSKSAFSVPYKSLKETKSGPTILKRMQKQFKDVHLVIIDEFSMISCGMLYWIDKRMREIWPHHSDEIFGGRDVYFTGDAGQLDPVVPNSLSTPITRISNDIQRRGREIWTGIKVVCILTSQNRGKDDPDWFDALRRLRRKMPTQADIICLIRAVSRGIVLLVGRAMQSISHTKM